jgi:hypothetical protein
MIEFQIYILKDTNINGSKLLIFLFNLQTPQPIPGDCNSNLRQKAAGISLAKCISAYYFTTITAIKLQYICHYKGQILKYILKIPLKRYSFYSTVVKHL